MFGWKLNHFSTCIAENSLARTRKQLVSQIYLNFKMLPVAALHSVPILHTPLEFLLKSLLIMHNLCG